MSRTRRSLSWTIGLAVAGAVVMIPVAASATTSASVTPVAGPDRYGTAIAASKDAWPDQQAQAAVLARSDAFPDALAGTPLAVARSAPLLLTPSTSLNPDVAAEIKRAVPPGRDIYLLGGTSALSDGVARSITNLGYHPVRLGGSERYATATVIDQQLGSPSAIFEATGQDFPYALIAGVAASKVHGVVVLTAGGQMPSATSTYLSQHAAATRIAVGPEAVAADPSATPVSGADRYDTSRLLAEQYFSNPTVAGVASGTVFADALSGGAHIGHLGGPLLLADPVILPSAEAGYLKANAPSIERAVTYGGTSAITTNVQDNVQNSVRGATYFGDGTYRIGTDIAAGTYRMRRDSASCYWERESGFSGSFNDIKANGISDAHDVVTIDPSDVGFKTSRCGTWSSDLSPLTASPTDSFGDGTWIVRTDIATGNWTAPGGSSCYWERLADFSGSGSSTLANDYGSTNPVVTLSASDAGFKTSRCGQWHRVS